MKMYKVRIYRDDRNESWEEIINHLSSAKAYIRKRASKSMPWMKYQILSMNNELLYKVERKRFGEVEFIKA